MPRSGKSASTATPAEARRKVRRSRPTIEEVARLSGVARSTVSGILNKRKDCYAAEATRERVTRAARELGYTPNPQARAMRGKKISTVGLITTALNVEVASIKCMAFETSARGNGYMSIITFNHTNEPQTEDQLINWLLERWVDGILVYPSEHGPHRMLHQLVDTGYPVVTFDGNERFDLAADDVSVDYFLGGQLQAQHMLEIGRRNLCFVNASQSCLVVDQRMAGAEQVLQASGIRLLPRMNLDLKSESPEDWTEEHEYQQIHLFLKQHRDDIDGVIAVGDVMGLAVAKVAMEMGIRIPQELAIVSFDGTSFGKNSAIPLTTVAQPCREVGNTAFELLNERLGAERTEPRKVILPPTLHIRASSVARST